MKTYRKLKTNHCMKSKNTSKIGIRRKTFVWKTFGECRSRVIVATVYFSVTTPVRASLPVYYIFMIYMSALCIDIGTWIESWAYSYRRFTDEKSYNLIFLKFCKSYCYSDGQQFITYHQFLDVISYKNFPVYSVVMSFTCPELQNKYL